MVGQVPINNFHNPDHHHNKIEQSQSKHHHNNQEQRGGTLKNDPDLLHRVSNLEKVKRKMATREDFDSAAKLKSFIQNVRGLADAIDSIESRMKKAAKEENYGEASRMKKSRESTRRALEEALDDAESTVRR